MSHMEKPLLSPKTKNEAQESSYEDFCSRTFKENAVLCYLHGMFGQRSNVLIQQVMVHFFTEDELELAKVQLLYDAGDEECKVIPNNIKAKHQKSYKKKTKDAGDLLSIWDHLVNVRKIGDYLPVYVTSDIFRIPSQDPCSNDPAVFQSDTKYLREEMDALRHCVDDMKDRILGEILDNVRDLMVMKDDVRYISERSHNCPCNGQTTQALCNGQTTKEIWTEPDTTVKADNLPLDVMGFFGKDCQLSNFHASSVNVYGRTFATSEHAYQYGKAMTLCDYDTAEKVFAAETPAQAKRLGSQLRVHAWLEETWNATIAGIMTHVCTKKFQQNRLDRDFLLSTAKKQLVEASSDQLWGCGWPLSSPNVLKPELWKGENLLGKILMETRKLLSQTNHKSQPILPSDNASVNKGIPMALCAAPHTLISGKSKLFSDTLKQPGEWTLGQQLRYKKPLRVRGSRAEEQGKTQITGVERINYTDFYIGQINKDATKDDIEQYIKEQKIEVTKLFALTTRSDTNAYRLRCPTTHRETVLEASTWPPHVVVRQWLRKPRSEQNDKTSGKVKTTT